MEFLRKVGCNLTLRIVMPSQPEYSGIEFLLGQMVGNMCGSWELWVVRQVIPRLGFKRKCPTTSSQLFVNNSAKTPVAFYHRRQLGIIGEARPASLEIFEAGKEMIDLIVVTGVYMEKLRKDKERAAR